jgi:hypothetical protein
VEYPEQSKNIERLTQPKLLDIVNVENCIKLAQKMGFEIFHDKVNIWAVRQPKGNFNDIFIYFWKEQIKPNTEMVWKSIITYGTTEPDSTYLQSLIKKGGRNPNGIAILIADKQYKDCWVFGKHKGKYEALQQYWHYKFTTYRKVKDDILYYDGLIYTDVAGLNMHTTRIGYKLDRIFGWSEGCQVIFDASLYFDKIIPMLKRYRNTKYSYTLVNFYQFYNLMGI